MYVFHEATATLVAQNGSTYLIQPTSFIEPRRHFAAQLPDIFLSLRPL